MANEYYTHAGAPAQSSSGSSATIRSEFDMIVSGFGKLPSLAGNANKLVVVNSLSNALTIIPASNFAASGSNNDITSLGALITVPTVVTTAISNSVANKANAGSNNDITSLGALITVPTVVITAISNSVANKANAGSNNDITSLGALNTVPTVVTNAINASVGSGNFAAKGANADITSLNVLNAINNSVNVNTSNAQNSISINDGGGSGANLKLVGNGATTPNKHIRSWSGVLQVINSAYTTAILNLTDAGVLSVAGGITATTQTANNNSTLVATTAYVDFQDIGVGQTWQNVTGSRATGSTYFNMTGRTIVVQAFSSSGNPNAAIQLTVSGVVVAYNAYALGGASAVAFVSAIVPAGASYIRTDFSVAATQLELR